MPRTEYLWDEVSDTLIGEYDENGDQIASYTTEPELYGPVISQHRANSGSSYYHHDAQGNTVALTDQSGDVTDTYAYNAFGETVQRTGATTNPFGFGGALGYYANPETGDHYIRERMYRAPIARWLSVDPSDTDGELMDPPLNLYTFADNNPVNAVDPSGLLPCDYKDRLKCIKKCAEILPLKAGFNAVVVGCDWTEYEYYTPWPCSTRVRVHEVHCKCENQPTRKCTKDLHRQLQAIVDSLCNHLGALKCLPGMDKDQALINAALLAACARARLDIKTRCFQYWDKGHRTQYAEKWAAAEKCLEIAGVIPVLPPGVSFG